MYVSTDKIKIGVVNFIDNEIGKKAQGVNKFITYFALPMITDKITNYVDSFSNNIFTKDMFDENKNVDIDKLYSYSKNAIQKSGQFVFMNIVFNETDIDKLYAYIKGDLI